MAPTSPNYEQAIYFSGGGVVRKKDIEPNSATSFEQEMENITSGNAAVAMMKKKKDRGFGIGGIKASHEAIPQNDIQSLLNIYEAEGSQ